MKHKENLASYKTRIASLAAQALKARTRACELAEECRNLVKQANDYARVFGLKARFEVPSEDSLKEAEKKAKQALKLEAAKRKAAQAKRQQELAEEAEKWKRGERRDSLPYDYPIIMLRVHGSRLETSRGAIVELESAKKLLPLIRSGKSWQRNGQKISVGDFQLDSIDSEGNVVIGCHKVNRQEIERVAAELNL